MNDDKKPKSKKRFFLSDQKKRELEGFEDALDLIDKGGVELKVNKKEAQIEDYEIYDFLEKEVARLEKIDQFFTVQMPIEKKYSQTKGLILKESAQLHTIKDEIIALNSQLDSSLCSFLDDLIRRSY